VEMAPLPSFRLPFQIADAFLSIINSFECIWMYLTVNWTTLMNSTIVNYCLPADVSVTSRMF
jgi:hypothetical protein